LNAVIACFSCLIAAKLAIDKHTAFEEQLLYSLRYVIATVFTIDLCFRDRIDVGAHNIDATATPAFVSRHPDNYADVLRRHLTIACLGRPFSAASRHVPRPHTQSMFSPQSQIAQEV